MEERHRAADRRELAHLMGYFAVVKSEDAVGRSISQKFRLYRIEVVRLMIATLKPLIRSIPHVLIVDFGEDSYEVWRL